MDYNFDELIDRRGTDSYKWDSAAPNVIPLWVADMDFRTPPFVVEALRKRVEHGVFGYTRVPESYFKAVAQWFARRHGWQMKREWMLYTSGVVPALSAVIKALTQPGDKVILQGPVYNCFYSSVRNNGCEVVSNSLHYENHTYSIDYDDLEQKAADPKARLLLFCNPHNPAGRVWREEELRRVAEICMKHDVWVVSDEIHCEFTFEGHRYIPFASLSEEILHRTITCNAPSKAFNTAGLQIANIISDNPEVRAKIARAINDNEVCDVNPFGPIALQAAYTPEGEEWLCRLNAYLWQNYQALCRFLSAELPTLPVARLEGTYLAWMDCRTLGKTSEKLEEYLLQKHRVWLNAGSMYGPEGEGFLRINMACPRARLMEGLRRTADGLKELL